jgi:hypothetical protein
MSDTRSRQEGAVLMMHDHWMLRNHGDCVTADTA